MRNTFYGILAVGLLLFLSSNIYANPTPDCKPSVQIQPVKGNYIPLLKGDVERLEKFIIELAEQNANYCNASLKIDFKKGLETKQTITHGKPKYNEKLYLEVQYVTPSYEVIIENAEGEILHKIELGEKLKSIEYSNPKLNNHDALYAEWRRIRRGNFSQIEKDANSFEALIDFLKTENGMSISENQALAINEKKEVLAPKGEAQKVEEVKKIAPKNKKTKSNKKSKAKKKKKESKKIANAETQSTQKNSQSEVEKKSKPTTKIVKEKSKEIAKVETQPIEESSASKVEKKPQPKVKVEEKRKKEIAKSESKPIKKIAEKPESKPTKPETKPEAKPAPKVSNNKSEKTQPKENASVDLEKFSPPTTSTAVAKTNPTQSQKSSEPREIISDDEMFGDAKVAEPLGEMIEFEFCSKSTYNMINESGFSMQVLTGRENKKEYAKHSVQANQKGIAKNEFKSGDWYAISYPEKLHLKDLENYKKEIASIWSDLKNPKMESDFNRLYDELNPKLQKIMEEKPNINNQFLPVVTESFEKFIAQTGTQSFKENQNQEAKDQIQIYLSRMVKSYELFHYYKYTIGSSVAHRPADEILNFKKGSKKKLSPNFILKGSVNWFLFNKNEGFSQYLESWPNTQLNAEIGLPFEKTRSKGEKIGVIRPYVSLGYQRQVFQFVSPNNYFVGGDYVENGDADSKIQLELSDKIQLRSESFKVGLLVKSIAANKIYFDLGGGIDLRVKSTISFDKNTDYFSSTDDSFSSNEQTDVLKMGSTPYAQFRFGKLFILGSSKKCGTKMKGGFDLYLSGYFSKVDLSVGENYQLYISEFSPTNEMPLVDLTPFKKWYFQLGAGIGYAF